MSKRIDVKQGKTRALLYPLLGATALSTMTVVAAPQVSAQEAAAGGIEEIVVTATRREETLSRVPVSVSAFNEDSLANENAKTLQDLQRSIPGLVYSSTGNTVAIRGISSGAGAPTTGVYIDDTPIQLLGIGIGARNPVPVLFDLDRVEVLRGPQGTLFGAGAEGGVVRYITAQPSLTDWSASARAEIGFIDEGEQNYEIGVGTGGPIIDGKLGFRISAFHQHEGGWVDVLNYKGNKNVIIKDANYSDKSVVRIAFAAEPLEGLRITPALQYQFDKRPNGDPALFEYDTDLGAGRFNSAPISLAPAKDMWYLPTLDIEYDIPNFATLTSNTALFQRDDQGGYDGGGYYARFYNGARNAYQNVYSGPPIISREGYYIPLANYSGLGTTANRQRTFSQEFRLASNTDGPLTWIAGVFHHQTRTYNYERLISPNDIELLNLIAGTAPGMNAFDTYTDYWGLPMLPGDISYFGDFKISDRQNAVFAEVTYNVTEELKLILGGRYSRTHFGYWNVQGGALNGTPSSGSGIQRENPFTPKFGISYQFDPENMLYATVAKGFRIGGANAPIPLAPCAEGLAQLGLTDAPDTYNSDKTWSYELGSKNRVMDGRVGLATSAFYVKWSNIQQATSIPICGFRFIGNAAEATAQGFDVAVNAVLGAGFSVDGSLGYTDAEYTKDVANPASTTRPFIVKDGTPLPGPRWKSSLAVQYDWEMLERPFFIRGTWFMERDVADSQMRTDPQLTSYDANIPKPPSTDLFTLRTGVTIDSFDVALFVDNLFDTHDRLTRAHAGNTNPLYTITTQRPRSFNFSVRYRY